MRALLGHRRAASAELPLSPGSPENDKKSSIFKFLPRLHRRRTSSTSASFADSEVSEGEDEEEPEDEESKSEAWGGEEGDERQEEHDLDDDGSIEEGECPSTGEVQEEEDENDDEKELMEDKATSTTQKDGSKMKQRDNIDSQTSKSRVKRATSKHGEGIEEIEDKRNLEVVLMCAGLVLAIIAGTSPTICAWLGGWMVYVLLIAGAILFLPPAMGWILSKAVTELALFGYPFSVGSLTIAPWIHRGVLHLRIYAQKIGFANPKGFPHKWFVYCNRVDLEFALPLRKLPGLLMMRKRKIPLKKNPDFTCFAVLEVPFIYFDGLTVNFELCEGKFNINQLTKEIAEKEVIFYLKNQERKEWIRGLLPRLREKINTVVQNISWTSLFSLAKWLVSRPFYYLFNCVATTSSATPAEQQCDHLEEDESVEHEDAKSRIASMLSFRAISRKGLESFRMKPNLRFPKMTIDVGQRTGSTLFGVGKTPKNEEELDRTESTDETLRLRSRSYSLNDASSALQSDMSSPLSPGPVLAFSKDDVDLARTVSAQNMLARLNAAEQGLEPSSASSKKPYRRLPFVLGKGRFRALSPKRKPGPYATFSGFFSSKRSSSCQDMEQPDLETDGDTDSERHDHTGPAWYSLGGSLFRSSKLGKPKAGGLESKTAVPEKDNAAATSKSDQTGTSGKQGVGRSKSRSVETSPVKLKYPIPNRLEITIVRAKNIPARDRSLFSGKKNVDPKVVIKLRDQQGVSFTRYNTTKPMWNEKFEFHVSDPSTVLHVAVMDEDFANDEFIGQWIMTLKWLILDPTYCYYNQEGFEVERRAPNDVMMKGWFPLMNKKWQDLNETGSIQMEIRWFHDPCLPAEYSAPARSALANLDSNSRETQLRLGDREKVIKMLNNVPVLFNIHRVTIHNVNFFLQDLFRGTTGHAEVLRRLGKSSDEASKIKIPSLEWRTSFRPRKGEPGITVYNVLYSFFITGLIPKVFNQNILSSALSQTATGFAINMIASAGSLLRGEKDLTKLFAVKVPIGSQLRTVARHVKKKFQGDLDGSRVNAEDEEYLLDASIEGYLEKVSVSKKADIHKGASKGFRMCYFELRGKTLFYTPVDGVQARKIVLDEIQLLSLDMKNKSIYIHRRKKITALRIPSGEGTLSTAPTPRSRLVRSRISLKLSSGSTAMDTVSEVKAESMPTMRAPLPDAQEVELLSWFEELRAVGANYTILS